MKQIEELVNYNLWANKRLINWLKINNEELLSQKCKSSFSTILDTVKHIVEGDAFYYAILKEQAVENIKLNTTKEVFSIFIKQSELFVNYLKDKKSLDEYRLFKSVYLEGNFKEYELIQHCMNHSTFHRGQLITIGHQLGLTKAPSTDMLLYLAHRNKTNN